MTSFPDRSSDTEAIEVVPSPLGVKMPNVETQDALRQTYKREGLTESNSLNDPVHPNMRLHAKEPLVPFPGLMHLWIPFPLLILRGCGGMDDGGVHHRTLPQSQALLFPLVLHCLEDLLSQLALLHNMAECQNGGAPGMGSLGKVWKTSFRLSPGFSKALL